MSLDAMFFQHDIFNYNGKDLYNLLGEGNWSFDDHHFGTATTTTTSTVEKEDHDDDHHQQDCKVVSFEFLENQTEKIDHYGNCTTTYSPPPPPPQPSSMVPHLNEWCCHFPNYCNNPDNVAGADKESTPVNSEVLWFDSSTISIVRPKRSRRLRRRKNTEEIENQRMTHIAVERNRRKQMNDYMSVLRSLMPDSYVQRGDQASIVGGAANYVKELEQRLQWLVGQQQKEGKTELKESLSLYSPFSEFFTFPQYSTSSSGSSLPLVLMNNDNPTAENKSAIADIEVTMVERHANLKIQSRKRVPKQLLKMVSGLQCLRLTILHLNVTTVDHIVLYCLSVKVEDECKLTSVEKIATAVHQILDKIQEEAVILN